MSQIKRLNPRPCFDVLLLTVYSVDTVLEAYLSASESESCDKGVLELVIDLGPGAQRRGRDPPCRHGSTLTPTTGCTGDNISNLQTIVTWCRVDTIYNGLLRIWISLWRCLTSLRPAPPANWYKFVVHILSSKAGYLLLNCRTDFIGSVVSWFSDLPDFGPTALQHHPWICI